MNHDMEYLQCDQCDRVYPINHDGFYCDNCGASLMVRTSKLPPKGDRRRSDSEKGGESS